MSEHEKLIKYQVIVGMIREAVDPNEIAQYHNGEHFAIQDVRSLLNLLDKKLQEVES